MPVPDFMKRFVFSCGAILTLTAFAKFYTLTGHAGMLDMPDPLFRLSYRMLLWIAGLAELATVVFLMLARDDRKKCLCVCCLGLLFALYRLGIVWLQPSRHCPCLGTVTQKLGIRPETADLALEVLLGYLLMGSLYFMLVERRRRRMPDSV